MYRMIFLIFTASIFVTIHCTELYSDQYDNIDVDAILADEKKRSEYLDCFMERGPCSDGGNFFRGNIPEVLATQCAKCTAWQKDAFDKTASWYAENDEATWNAFIDKYIKKAKEMNIAGA